MSDLSNDNGGSGLQINKFVFWNVCRTNVV